MNADRSLPTVAIDTTETIWRHFAAVAANQPDRLAIVDGARQWTYRELHDQSVAYARAFLAQGVEHGDHVAVWLKNCAEWIAAQLALAQIGAVLVPLNTRFKAEEIRYCLHQSDAVLLLTMPEFVGIDYHAILGEIIPQAGDAALPKLRQVVSLGESPFPGGLTLGAFLWTGNETRQPLLAARRDVVRADDISLIIYTSGTTGGAKGAMHDQSQVLLNASAMKEYASLTPADRMMMLGPFFYIMGFSFGVNSAMHAGAASVALPTFDAAEALDILERQRITAICGTPTQFQMMMALPQFEQCDRSSMRYAVVGGAPATPTLIEEIMQRFPGIKMSCGFGMSETMGAMKSPPNDPPELIANTCGVPHNYVEVRIVDPDNGVEVPQGQGGELWLRGPNITRGYYKMPEATAAVITPDGWLRTGDLFVQEPDGHLRITGRLKELYIRGGSNVYPSEVENFLSRHPAIHQLWVIGVPDELYGEVGMAFVQLRPGAQLSDDELKAYCKGKIAGYKIPQYVHFTDEFPLTASGKVQKFKLRELGCALLGLS